MDLFFFNSLRNEKKQVEHMLLMILERGNLSTPSSFLGVREFARFSLFPFTLELHFLILFFLRAEIDCLKF